MSEGLSLEEKYQLLDKYYTELQYENERLSKELKTAEAIEDKLEDRIDGLEQIITILTKIYL